MVYIILYIFYLGEFSWEQYSFSGMPWSHSHSYTFTGESSPLQPQSHLSATRAVRVDGLAQGHLRGGDMGRGKRCPTRDYATTAPNMTVATCRCVVKMKMRLGKTGDHLSVGTHLLWCAWCSRTDDMREVSLVKQVSYTMFNVKHSLFWCDPITKMVSSFFVKKLQDLKGF